MAAKYAGRRAALCRTGIRPFLVSLISFWELETTGWADSFGSNTLTDHNTVVAATGKVGNGADFEADSSQFLSHASNASLQTGDIDWAFSFWIKPETVTGDHVIISRDGAATGNRELTIMLSSGHINFSQFRATDTEGTLVSAAALSAGTWYHIVCQHITSPNTIEMYINNGAVDTASPTGVPQAAGTAQFQIGAREYSGAEQYFDGIVDQVGFWKRTLTAAERTTLYNGGSGLSYAAMADL